ncbi:hypothetical protein HBF24_11550 [Oleiagrimonas sp. C23AA]|nr:hypothetical protein [Oleiagrimonas sp. C23AA]
MNALLGLLLAGAIACAPASGATPSTATAYLRLFDTNRDGRVSLAEYSAWLMRGFDRLDRNHDGILETEELPPGHHSGALITRRQRQADIARVFHRQDTNHDGYLDARELAAPPR